MKAVWNYLICVLDKPDEVKTSSWIYLDAKKESDVYKVISSSIPEIPDNCRVAIDSVNKEFTIGGKKYVMVHKEYVFAII